MYAPWIQFSWDGHRRGTIQFQVQHDLDNNITRYNVSSEENIATYVEVARSDLPRTLYDTINIILSTEEAVIETYAREFPNIINMEQLHESENFIEWVWTDFRCDNAQYLQQIDTLTFQGKINYDNRFNRNS